MRQITGRRVAHRAGQGEELVDRLIGAAMRAPHRRRDDLQLQACARHHGAGHRDRPGAGQGFGDRAAERPDPQPDRLHPGRAGALGGGGHRIGHGAEQTQFMHRPIVPPVGKERHP
ncbi:hypothetical protein SDC9_142997 [bioreactor metagenome]|uniref:Uncharacterized protein n=1 Tax=bioreactor metagenome TaxID=1076179 RepID=A0A645E5J6_9ZZZZ